MKIAKQGYGLKHLWWKTTMNEYQLRQEIARVKKAINITNSEHLKKDYSKYLKRLEREL